MNIQTVVSSKLSNWRRVSAPADDVALARLLKSVAIPLPPEHLSLLRVTNGGEGSLGISPWWFQLWSASEIPELNTGYETASWFPEYFCFGSSGGGEMFAFRRGAESKVFGIPFSSSDPNDIIVIAESFFDFAAALGQEPNNSFESDALKTTRASS